MRKSTLSPCVVVIHGERISAGCHDGTHRYHVWLSDDARTIERGVVFKNPTDDSFAKRRQTIYLSEARGMGKAIAAHLLAAAPGLLPAAQAEYEAEERVKEAGRKVQAHGNAMRAAGPELYRLLSVVVNADNHNDALLAKVKARELLDAIDKQAGFA